MSDSLRYSFGSFSLQPGSRTLLDNGLPVAIGGRAFDLLVALIEGRDRIVGKEELLRRIWPGHLVEENNLTVNVSVLRKLLRERSGGQRAIMTVSGRGYRFVAPVEVHGREADPVFVAPPDVAPSQHAAMPGIAVLPFTPIGNDLTDTHFGDGIAEDIIAELSRNRWLTVIARSSSFSFRGAPVDAPEIARQLAVRYVLDGSIRTAGGRARVTVRLIDADNNTHLVAERYDRALADLFSVQDEITTLIIEAVRPALYEAEQTRSIRRHPDSLDAWAAYQRGVLHVSRPGDLRSVEAARWFERAIELDARYAPGYYGLALVYLHDGSGFLPNAPADWQPRGEELALKAVSLDPRDSGAHSILGLARMLRGDHAGALQATRKAIALNPNDATAHGTQGAALVFSGKHRNGLDALATSLRLSPRDHRLHVRYSHIGLGLYFARRHGDAEEQARALIRDWPGYGFGYRLLAMVLAELGRTSEAASALGKALAFAPASFENFTHERMPWYRPADHARAVDALHKAGWTGPPLTSAPAQLRG